MALINMMEKLVEDKMNELLEKNPDCCGCEQCREDIMALALNNLPAKYVSTSKGELFSKVNSVMVKQNSVDLNIAVINALEFVKGHPHHN